MERLTPEFPVGSPEYTAYRRELRAELAKFAAGDPPYEYSKDLLMQPVQGPAGAPFRPGDRFRMVSGNGQVVRTGKILDWWAEPAWSGRAPRSWGSWYVEVDPLPKPRGARPRKNNSWDGFRSWFDADSLERVT